jgi:cystathionine beta-lyase/cystathionine gamma-synthase
MALERNIAAIEAGTAAFAFASGMAAIDALLTRLESGDHVLVSDNTYGGTFRLFERVRRKFGLDFTYIDTSKPELVEPAIKPNTKYLFIETPTNPMLHITDIQCVSSIAHRKHVKVIVDNTFASPYIQRPLTMGADIVVHSTTKFLNGHSDSVGGVVILRHQDDVDWMKFVQNAAGAILGPMDSWLILRGTKTLTIRMERTNENAQIIAEYLADHPKVKRTIYPGLTSHPHHSLARKQMRGFGGLISFDVGSLDNAKTVLERLRLMALAESLGGVETLISHPAIMTHASVPKDRREMLGITDGLIRISVGIEDVEDLQADLEQALSAL